MDSHARFHYLLSNLGSAEAIALQHFRDGGLRADNKEAEKGEGGYDPVTVADREIELYLREVLLQEYPEDAILGEEFASQQGQGSYEWVIDPIDGTRAFVIGSPSFAILVALKQSDQLVAGVISQPFTGERFVADGRQAYWQRGEDRRSLKTSSVVALQDVKLASTFPEIGSMNERKAFEKVSHQVQLTRYGMDAYAYGLLALGHIDLVIEAGLKPYDYSAPQAVVEAAGGVVMNWEGQMPRGEDRIIAAANQELAEKALAVLNS